LEISHVSWDKKIITTYYYYQTLLLPSVTEPLRNITCRGVKTYSTNTVYGKKSFLSTESDTKIFQSIYFAYKAGIISSYSNRNQCCLL